MTIYPGNRILSGLLLWLALTAPGETATLTISCGAVGQELELCRQGAEAWAAQHGHQIEVISTPNSSTERLALYQQLLAARAADVDVFQIDVIWPGILASELLDLSAVDSAAGHFPAMLDNNRVEGRLVALPWFTDAGLLYYRRDLLQQYDARIPETWTELTQTAGRIQRAERQAGNQGLWGYVWQGRAYEGLTCNALEWLASHGAGLFDDAGEVAVDTVEARAALEQASTWVGTISPPGVLNYSEEEARGLFQSGNALFMRNWPYAWRLSQTAESPVRDLVGVTRLPRGSGGEHVATLGGWSLAVSRYSRYPELAIDLVGYLTGPEEQKRRAIIAGYNPTRPALYQDSEILQANPLFTELADIFTSAIARPSSATGRDYNCVSSAFWSAVHGVLSKQTTPERALARLQHRLQRIKRRGGW